MEESQDNAGLERVVESIVTVGDLSKLQPKEKAHYYTQICVSLGLNPATQPFALLKLNGKEVIYASRGATDQLAAIHRINRRIVDGPKLIELEGQKLIYALCEATHPNGRVETSVATIPFRDPQNDLMKCETKAKRRATLSLLGLGMLDETELETIPQSAIGEVKQIAIPPKTIPQSVVGEVKPTELLIQGTLVDEAKKLVEGQQVGVVGPVKIVATQSPTGNEQGAVKVNLSSKLSEASFEEKLNQLAYEQGKINLFVVAHDWFKLEPKNHDESSKFVSTALLGLPPKTPKAHVISAIKVLANQTEHFDWLDQELEKARDLSRISELYLKSRDESLALDKDQIKFVWYACVNRWAIVAAIDHDQSHDELKTSLKPPPTKPTKPPTKPPTKLSEIESGSANQQIINEGVANKQAVDYWSKKLKCCVTTINVLRSYAKHSSEWKGQQKTLNLINHATVLRIQTIENLSEDKLEDVYRKLSRIERGLEIVA